MAQFQASRSTLIPDVIEYWPEVKDDLTLVTWSHATNSKQKLEDALRNNSIMMMEADVVMGRIYGENDTVPIQPVMAHTPDVYSDITLKQFLQTILKTLAEDAGIKKGIKLDFKSLDAAEGGLAAVFAIKNQIICPLWVNADIAKVLVCRSRHL